MSKPGLTAFGIGMRMFPKDPFEFDFVNKLICEGALIRISPNVWRSGHIKLRRMARYKIAPGWTWPKLHRRAKEYLDAKAVEKVLGAE